jgi:CheY-like chemotaxis protein
MSPSTERKRGPAPGRPPTILIVEDEVLMRLVLADYLRSCGYRVVEANTADEAVTILSKTDETVDIVFSDVQMPGTMDGFALARWLRREHPEIKVVLTSGVAKASDAAGELCEDENPLISKPYDAQEVERRIRIFLAR